MPGRLCVRARPPVRGSGDAWGSLRLFWGLREACLGVHSCVWVLRASWDLGLSRQAGGRSSPPPSLFPSLPPCICPGSRRAEGRGRGGRGPGVPCPARPDPAGARPPLCEGSGESASRGGRRSCSRGEGEWQPVKRHFRNVNIKIGAIQPRSCSPPTPPPRGARDSILGWRGSGEGVRQLETGGGSCYYNRGFRL